MPKSYGTIYKMEAKNFREIKLFLYFPSFCLCIVILIVLLILEKKLVDYRNNFTKNFLPTLVNGTRFWQYFKNTTTP